jgi:TP901 family phage tail tape measure protein
MERVVRVSLAAQVNGFVNGMNQAEQAARKAKAGSEEATAAYERQKQAMNEAGVALGAVGAVAMASTALAVKAAIDWESAWAGVTKTVDGSASEMASLEGELRGLATTLPATHQEIAAVAEAAGQLGIERQNVAAFTKTMVDLGETTNLTADQAATSLAQLMNVMQTAPADIERLGATLVALGNDGASTEAEILEMAQRIAGAGKLIGASEGEVLGLANALASMGVTAELGGGVASRILQDLYSAVQTGGEKLEGFSKVAGVSAREFATQFRNDPVRALDAFAKGLNGVESSGGNVVATLSDLGFRSSEEQRVLLQLKGAGDLLAESLDLQAVAWEENTALANEAAKRYATTEAQLQVMSNRVNEAAIEYGDVFLPAVQAAAQVVGELALGFAELPQPIQTTVAVTGALIGVVGLAGGAFLLAVPKIAEFRVALATLSTSSMPAVAAAATGVTTAVGKTVGGLSAAARFMTGPWGLALAAAAVGLVALQQHMERMQASADEMMNAAVTAESAEQLLTKAFQGIATGFVWDDGSSAMREFSKNLQEIGRYRENIFAGFTNGPGAGSLQQALANVNDALGPLAQQNLPQAARAFDLLASKTDGSTEQLAVLLDELPAYRDALIAQATAQGLNVSAMSKAERTQALLNIATEAAEPAVQSAGDAYQESARQAKELTDRLVSLIDTMDESNDVAGDAIQANARYREALDGIATEVERQKEAYEEANGTLDGFTLSLDRSTTAGAANASALYDVSAAARDAAEAQYNQDLTTMSAEDATRKYIDTLNGQRQAFIDTATQAGYNADEVSALADEIFRVPSSKETDLLVNSAQARDATQRVKDLIDSLPWTRRIQIIAETVQTGVSLGSLGAAVNGRRANGGIIPGPPSAKDNRIYAVATGEFIVNARQTAIPENRAALEYINSGGRIRGYAGGGYVNGYDRYDIRQPVYASSSSRVSGAVGTPLTVESLVAALKAHPRISITEVNPIHTDPVADRLSGQKTNEAGELL